MMSTRTHDTSRTNEGMEQRHAMVKLQGELLNQIDWQVKVFHWNGGGRGQDRNTENKTSDL